MSRRARTDTRSQRIEKMLADTVSLGAFRAFAKTDEIDAADSGETAASQ